METRAEGSDSRICYRIFYGRRPSLWRIERWESDANREISDTGYRRFARSEYPSGTCGEADHSRDAAQGGYVRILEINFSLVQLREAPGIAATKAMPFSFYHDKSLIILRLALCATF